MVVNKLMRPLQFKRAWLAERLIISAPDPVSAMFRLSSSPELGAWGRKPCEHTSRRENKRNNPFALPKGRHDLSRLSESGLPPTPRYPSGPAVAAQTNPFEVVAGNPHQLFDCENQRLASTLGVGHVGPRRRPRAVCQLGVLQSLAGTLQIVFASAAEIGGQNAPDADRLKR